MSLSGGQQNRDHHPRAGEPAHHSRPGPDLAAADDLSSLAAAICFPGCTTRLDTAVTPPLLIIGHPYMREPQCVTAEGEFFWWDRPAGRSRFSVRGGGISRAAGAASMLLACLIVEQAGRGEAGA